MSNCEKCSVKELSSLEFLHSNELVDLSNCKSFKTIKKGELIFDEGENVNGVYCIRGGVCKLTKLSSNGKSHLIKLVGKGELLGFRSLITEEKTNLKSVALCDMQVCLLPKQKILELLNDNNKFSKDVLKRICNDLKQKDDQIVVLAQKSVKQRLANLLIGLHSKFGEKSDKSLNIYLSREEIANTIGVALETCMRTFSDLKKSGLIELKSKKIYIKDHIGLKKYSL